MRIAILEKTKFTNEQINKLKNIGTVDFYDSLTQEAANRIAVQYDIVVVNWLDPTPFLLNMKPGSLVSLLSTGYGWISNIKEAYKNQIYVSNIPNYSTEAVAEHLLGMLLGISKNIFPTLNTEDNNKVGFELANKTVGIIGLGNIGTRFAEIMHFFGANIITYNRTMKNSVIAKDVPLDVLLEKSDIICISCAVNDESKNLINMSNIQRLKKGTVLVGSTWNIIDNNAMIFSLDNNIVKSISFDAAIEGDDYIEEKLKKYSDRVFFTPHIAYNTSESEIRQLNICVENICAFAKGCPQNIVF